MTVVPYLSDEHMAPGVREFLKFVNGGGSMDALSDRFLTTPLMKWSWDQYTSDPGARAAWRVRRRRGR